MSTNDHYKKTITRIEYQQLLGLGFLASRHMQQQRDIQSAIAQIIGEEDEMGHAGDVVFGDVTIDRMLEKIDCTVELAGTDVYLVHLLTP